MAIADDFDDLGRRLRTIGERRQKRPVVVLTAVIPATAIGVGILREVERQLSLVADSTITVREEEREE